LTAYKVVIALSCGINANPLRLTVQPQYRTIGIVKCPNDL